MTEISQQWLQFLKLNGARMLDPAVSEVSDFGVAISGDTVPDGFIAPLTDLGLIAASGEDAARFLHSQLTNDVEHLDASDARLAGYCSPKGRLLATFMMWKSADTIFLQLPRLIQPAIQKRLQMFVLRAKAKLVDVSDSHAVIGLAGKAVTAALQPWFPDLPATPYAKIDSAAGSLIRMPDADGLPRYQWIAPIAVAEEAWPVLTKTLHPVGPRVWRLTDIRAGIPQVTLPTQEQFVPQMINFEAIGGVSFKKGCYPGQEIVARSQYRGKLKRRMVRATIALAGDVQAQAGMEVFASDDPTQPCGMLVNAETYSSGALADCLVEIKTAVLEQGSVHLGSISGPALQFKTLPYSLPDAE